MTTEKIKLELYPTRFGNDNVTEAFYNKKIGFQLELTNETSIQRNLLSLDDVIELKRQINSAITAYDEFMDLNSKLS